MATLLNAVLTNTVVPTVSEGPGSQEQGWGPRLGAAQTHGWKARWRQGFELTFTTLPAKGKAGLWERAEQEPHTHTCGAQAQRASSTDVSLLLTHHKHHQLHKGFLGERYHPHGMHIVLSSRIFQLIGVVETNSEPEQNENGFSS